MKHKLIGIALSTMLLAACGGSGSSSNDSTTPNLNPNDKNEPDLSESSFKLKFENQSVGYFAYRVDNDGKFSEWKNLSTADVETIALSETLTGVELAVVCSQPASMDYYYLTRSTINESATTGGVFQSFCFDSSATMQPNPQAKTVTFTKPNGYEFITGVTSSHELSEYFLKDPTNPDVLKFSLSDNLDTWVNFLFKSTSSGELKEFTYAVSPKNLGVENNVSITAGDLTQPKLTQKTVGITQPEHITYMLGVSQATAYCTADSQCWNPSNVNRYNHYKQVGNTGTGNTAKIYLADQIIPSVNIANTYLPHGILETTYNFNGKQVTINAPTYVSSDDSQKYSYVSLTFQLTNTDFLTHNYNIVGGLPSETDVLNISLPNLSDLPSIPAELTQLNTNYIRLVIGGTSAYSPSNLEKNLNRHSTNFQRVLEL